MAEIVDIVDEQDEVVGQITKEEAHAKQLAHRIGVVFVFYKGKLLVQRRTLEKDGLLDHSTAGHVGAGETYQQAAQREMDEEIGVHSPIHYIGTVSSFRERGEKSRYQHWYGLFETEISDEQFYGMRLAPREVAEMIPMTLEEIAEQMRMRRLDFSGGFPLTLTLYAKVKGLALGTIPLNKPEP